MRHTNQHARDTLPAPALGAAEDSFKGVLREVSLPRRSLSPCASLSGATCSQQGMRQSCGVLRAIIHAGVNHFADCNSYRDRNSYLS